MSLSGDEEDEVEVVRADSSAARVRSPPFLVSSTSRRVKLTGSRLGSRLQTLPKGWSGDFTATLPSRPLRKKRQRPSKVRFSPLACSTVLVFLNFPLLSS